MKNRLYKIISIILAVTMIFSVCLCAVGAVSAEATAQYYVKSTGSDSANGTSADTPFQTINKVIYTAKSAGLGAGDTVYVDLMGYPEITWNTTEEFDFDLVIKSNTPGYPDLRSNILIPDGFVFGGNVSFQKVIIGSVTTVYYNNKNIIFDENCTFLATNHYFGKPSVTAGETVTTAQTVSFGNAILSKNIRLSDKTTGGKTYSEDVNLIFANAKATPAVNLAANSGSTVFDKNLNINVMSAKSIELSVSGGEVAVNGAIQLIVNSDTPMLEEYKNTLKALEPEGGFYYITNATRVADMINTTDVAGVYAVDTERYDVKAKDANNNEYIAEDGILELPNPGEYVVTVVKDVENPVYYVSASGSSSNTGLSSESPFSHINDVVKKAVEEGYWEGDTVYVNVIGSTVEWNKDKDKDDKPVTTDYNFLLYVQSNDKSSLSTVTMPHRTELSGDVYFENIKISISSSQGGAKSFYANSKSITIGDNVTFNPADFSFGNFNTSGKYNGQTVVFKNAYRNSISLGNAGHHNGKSFGEDVNLVIDNEKFSSIIYYTAYHGGTVTMKKNFNIDIKNAESVEFRKGGSVNAETVSDIKVEGAVQLIVNKDVDLSEESINILKNRSVNNKFYHIINASGVDDLLEFTETAGKYALTLGSDRCIVTATDIFGEVKAVSEDGYLTLPQTGTYVITAETLPVTKTYYVKADAIENGDGSEASPFVGSLDDIIIAANKAGYVAGDTVVVKVVGTAAVAWGIGVGTTPKKLTAHDYKLVVTSATSGATIGDGTTITLNGEIDFENIKIDTGSSPLCLGYKNINFTSDVTGLNKVVMGYQNGGGTITESAYVTVEAPISNVGMANVNSATNINPPLYLTYNNSSKSVGISFGSSWGKVNYNSAVNINVKAASGVSFSTGAYEGGCVFGENAKIQIINSSSANITSDMAGLADISVPKWIITNNTADKELIAFTETAGKFAVDSDKYKVTAADESGNSFTAKNGFLTLAEGEYTVTIDCVHSYTDICDEICNGCPYVRTSAHEYTNACDIQCNLCPKTRTVGDHIYKNVIDTDCEECGDVRKLVGKVVFEAADGNLYYFVDGARSYETTLVKHNGEWLYIQNGKWNDKARTLVKYEGVWFFVENGVWNKTARTLVKMDNVWFYVENGRWNKTAETVVKYNNVWFYVKNGRWDTTGNTLIKYGSNWLYIKNGRWDNTARTLIKYKGVWFFVEKGVWNKTAETVVKYNNVWFYVKNGKWDTTGHTLVKYGGNWLYIKNGRWANTANTYFTYKNVKFKIVKGVAQV